MTDGLSDTPVAEDKSIAASKATNSPKDSIDQAKSALDDLFANRNANKKSHAPTQDQSMAHALGNKEGIDNTDNNSESADVQNNNNQTSEEDPQDMGALASPDSTPANLSSKPCMQLKGSLVPMTVLELNYFDPDQFREDLKAKTSQAPEFFDNLPVIIGLEKFDEASSLPFNRLIDVCKEFSIRVVAVRGGPELLQSSAKQIGLGVLAKQKERSSNTGSNNSAQNNAPLQKSSEVEEKRNSDNLAQPQATQVIKEVVKEVEVVKTVVEKSRQVSKVVHHPIRSGQQVYAADGDLIVLASVSAGAEILADGNIHVYGTLRGRALAGVKGDTKARIFCHSMAAELVSIAGQYKISEDLDKSILGKPAQAYLDEDALKFGILEL